MAVSIRRDTCGICGNEYDVDERGWAICDPCARQASEDAERELAYELGITVDALRCRNEAYNTETRRLQAAMAPGSKQCRSCGAMVAELHHYPGMGVLGKVYCYNCRTA